jgi:hypothetical protein
MNMSSRAFLVVMAVAGCLAVLDAPAVGAQPTPAAPKQADTSWHHQMLYRIMKDMTAEMGQMTEQMSRTD